MRRFSNITITMHMLVAAIVIVVISLATLSFLYIVVQNLIRPFFFEKTSQTPNVSLDNSLDEAAEFMKQRGGDLTASSPSATLIEEEKNATPEGR